MGNSYVSVGERGRAAHMKGLETSNPNHNYASFPKKN